MTEATGNPFWTFSLALYGRPGIEDFCLKLQDRVGADVNLMLYAMWAGAACGTALTESRLSQLEAMVHAWRSEIIEPLRKVRRRLKVGPPPSPDATTERLRTTVKTAELAAEHLAQDMLYQTGGLFPRSGSEPLATAAACAEVNLRVALGARIAVLDPARLEYVARLAALVARGETAQAA